MFKGSRIHGGDYFDDIASREDAGVFSGLGVEDYEGIGEQMSDDGLVIRMNCRGCGKQHDVTLEWMELYICGTNMPGASLLKPRGWEYSQNNAKLYPNNIPCSKCSDKLCPQITPDEARQRVNDAVQRGLVPMQALAGWKHQVDMVRGQQGG
jgi:hypothetical protein